MAADPPTNDALSALGRDDTVPDVLAATARTVVDALGARAATVSRVIGDLLVDLVEYSPSGPIAAGHGYLVSDYPATREVLERVQTRAVFVADPEADAREVELLRDFGFDSLLMVPLVRGGQIWGLVEVYDVERGGFTDDDVATGEAIVARAGVLLEERGDT